MNEISNNYKEIIYHVLYEYKKQFNNDNLFISDIIISDNDKYWAEFSLEDLYNQNYILRINSKLIHKSNKFIKRILYHEFTHLLDALNFSDCKNIDTFKCIMSTYSECHASEIEMTMRLNELKKPIGLNSKINKDETIKAYIDQSFSKAKNNLSNMIEQNASINIIHLYYFCGYLKAIRNYNINYDYDKMSFPMDLIVPCNEAIDTLVCNEYCNIKKILYDYIQLTQKILELRKIRIGKMGESKKAKILFISRRILTYNFLMFIIGFATLLVTRCVDLFRKPYITMSDDIPISFMINNEYSGYYDLNYQRLQDEISFPNQMVTLVNICNSLSNNIQLNKIYIDISNIKQDINPYFNIFSQTRDDGIYLDISNCGWGNANDIDFSFTCSDDIIFDYIGKNTINIHINEIKCGETINCPFILNKDINEIDVYSTIDFSAYCSINGVNAMNMIKNAFLSYEIHNGIISDPDIAIGGPGDYIYGIQFDTSKTTFSIERAVLEEINSGEVYIIPICIFPDQTCTFDIDIKFQYLYNGKQKYIRCQKKNLKIEISSTYLDDFKIDISKLSQEEIDKKIQEYCYYSPESAIFSYPFINNLVIYPKCPVCDSVLHCQLRILDTFIPSKRNEIWKCDNCNAKY